jgi:ketosteroid isomerase-like protein
VSLALAACGGPGPSKVARQFFAAIEKGDVGQLPKCATAETVATARVYAEKARGYVAARGGVASTEEAIDGKKAVVTVKFKDGSTEKIDLVKVKGKWKVSIKK